MNREDYLHRSREFASRGERRHNARLNPDSVRWIRNNPNGMTAKAMADHLGVHYRTIEKARYYETWAHVR